MNYPEKLNNGDFIGITAPSMGIVGDKNNKRADNAKKNLEKEGYNVKETLNVRTMERARSSGKKQRSKEFMELWNDETVKAIICAEGGDFLCEMLDEIDFEKIKKSTPKWILGYSDITNLGYVFTTNLDIATIYGPTYKSFGMKSWHISLKNALKLMKKEEFLQYSYDKCEKFTGWEEDTSKEENPYEEYELIEDTKWINLNNENKIQFSGRCLGGCLDVIKDLIGTKYDKVNEYIEKYKEDGIVWFLESFETSTPALFRTLWQMKSAGYFKNCKGIIFGRPLIVREDFNLSYYEMIKDAMQDLDVPIICDADIGHLAPQIPIVNGAILEIKSENGKGQIKNIFR